MSAQPVSILLCALGGEGGGVLSGWLVEAARAAGLPAQATSIPGVAQRTGATTYYLEILPKPPPEGRKPVLGLNPLPGKLDLLVSSELLETVRQIGNGLASAGRTRVISNSARVLTTAEKMVMGDGRRDEARLREIVDRFSREHQLVDMSALSREAGTVLSAVMLGCIAASGALPIGRAHFEAVLQGEGAAARASRKGFELGYQALAASVAMSPEARRDAQRAELAAEPLAQGLADRFPQAAHAWISLGRQRLVEYQGESYAALYVQRLEAVMQAGQASGAPAAAVVAETARWLALWMAFDDVIRVAGLKCRPERMLRVRREAGARDGELVRVYDHFKPGIPELAGLLPESLAARLLAWDRRRVMKGLTPWSMPLRIATHSPSGWLALRLLSLMRFARPLGSRYRAEQRAIEQWLDAVIAATREDARLGLELARCGRLIKGYGSTNERGKRNLAHLLEHVARPGLPIDERRQAIERVREAALQDEAGRALDQALKDSGAPARPVETRPVLWMKNPRSISRV